jgi:hypothetical protein
MPKFNVGDKVKVPENTQGGKQWWRGKHATVRAVYEENDIMYEVLFDDASDFDFIVEELLTPASA